MKPALNKILIASTLLLIIQNSGATSLRDILRDTTSARPVITPSGQQTEVGFSPEGSGEQLVLKAIASAKTEIRILSYSFTSSRIVAALIDARHRGVDISLVVDYKNNISQDSSGKAVRALNALSNAGAKVRTVSVYAIHHDKTMIIDQRHIQTGSFNYSEAAANRNSENVIVIWNNADLAKVYLDHWRDRFSKGQDYTPRY